MILAQPSDNRDQDPCYHDPAVGASVRAVADIRARAVYHQVPRCGGGHRDGQQHAVWSGCQRLHQQHCHIPDCGQRAAGRNCLVGSSHTPLMGLVT